MKIVKQNFIVGLISLILFVSLSSSVLGQKSEASKNSKRLLNLKLNSSLMGREMPYRVLTPIGYDTDTNKTKSYPVIYLLHGLTGKNTDWSNNTELVEHSSKYGFIIVMPEGNNGWYTDSQEVQNHKYESYIVKELIPEIENKFRAKKDRQSRIIAGLSMGGFGALKFGVKYPEKFILAGSFSGALGAAQIPLFVVKNNKVIHDSLKSAFGGMDSENRKANDLYKLVEGKSSEQTKDLPFIYMDCGNQDFLIGDNRKFAELLFKKKIPHEVRFLPGVHNWKFWDKQIVEFLELSSKFTK